MNNPPKNLMTVESQLVVAEPNPRSKATDLSFLTNAFSEFISASAALETSYQHLQMEVAQLSSELAERNATLKSSLAENERMHGALKQIVDSMPCGILVVDEEGTVSMVNAEAGVILGVHNVFGLELSTISARSGVDLSTFLARRTGPEDEQEFCVASPERPRWISVHKRSLLSDPAFGTPLEDKQQTILILRDVSTSKQSELDREQMRQAVALSEISTTLAHEIRNPLASLELFTELLAKGGEDATEWISHLRAGIRSLGGIVNNVLSIRGAGVPSMDRLDLSEVLESSVEFVRPIADEAGISLSFVSTHAIWIRANANAMQQLVLNIIGNSIRHTKAGGNIRVKVGQVAQTTHHPSGCAAVEFSDTGSGIAEDNIAKIFQLGYSGDGNSSGLGLAVCQQIVCQHAGSIRVESIAGEGTKFYVEIPTL